MGEIKGSVVERPHFRQPVHVGLVRAVAFPPTFKTREQRRKIRQKAGDEQDRGEFVDRVPILLVSDEERGRTKAS